MAGAKGVGRGLVAFVRGRSLTDGAHGETENGEYR